MALSQALQEEFNQRSSGMNADQRRALRAELEARNVQSQSNNNIPTPDTPIVAPVAPVSAPIVTPVAPVSTAPIVIPPATPVPTTTTDVQDTLLDNTATLNQVGGEIKANSESTVVRDLLKQQERNAVAI